MRRALALLALAVLTACSSSHDRGAAAPGTSTAPASNAASAPTGAASPSTGASAVPGATARSTASAGPSAAPSSAAPLTTTAPGKPAASKATAPGTYTYDSSGTTNGGQQSTSSSTLVISALANGMQTSTLHNDQGDTVQQVLVRDAGSYLSTLKISSLMGNKEFAFSPAALLLPDPARAGASWSWTSTSTDGKTTAKATNRVARTETLTIGGQQVATVVLQTHLVLTGDYDYTADVTTWVAPAYRLPVKDHTVGKGTFGKIPFSFDVTDVMRSVHPA